MGTNTIGWIEALTNNDVETLWAKLFNLISKHSSVRMLYPPNELSSEMVRDNYCDLTQDLFLRLFEKKRWQYYLDNGYSDEKIQQELYRIEVPNMITLLQRERHPESYRIARRISDLIKTRRRVSALLRVQVLHRMNGAAQLQQDGFEAIRPEHLACEQVHKAGV